MFKLRNATIEDLPNCLVCAKKFVDFYGTCSNEKNSAKFSNTQSKN